MINKSYKLRIKGLDHSSTKQIQWYLLNTDSKGPGTSILLLIVSNLAVCGCYQNGGRVIPCVEVCEED